MKRLLLLALLAFQSVPNALADLIVNSDQPITSRVTVNPIVYREDEGTNAATYLGSASQEAGIKVLVDQVWAQAGIDIAWGPVQWLNSTEGLNGGITTVGVRPVSDLSAGADSLEQLSMNAGLHQSDQVNMHFVDVVPLFEKISDDGVAGLAEIPGDDVAIWVGSNLLGFAGGQESIASVVAHEIGHNLGLEHLVAAPENLMQVGSNIVVGQRLNATQITTARSSPLATSISDPGSTGLDNNSDGIVDANDLNFACQEGNLEPLLDHLGLALADADGANGVDFRDFAVLARNFGKPGAAYTEGDFNCSSIVDFRDFAVLATNFGAGRTASVPEPTGLLVWGFVVAWILRSHHLSGRSKS